MLQLVCHQISSKTSDADRTRGRPTRWNLHSYSLLRSTRPGAEHATRVQALLLGGPLAAEVRLGRPAICPEPAVKRTPDSVVIQVPAGGDYLGLDRKITGPFHLAEIRRTPGPH